MKLVLVSLVAAAAAATLGTPASAEIAPCEVVRCDSIAIACLPVVCPAYPDVVCYNDGSLRFCI